MKGPDYAGMQKIHDEAWKLIRSGEWTKSEYDRLLDEYRTAAGDASEHTIESFLMLEHFLTVNPYAGRK